MFKSILETILGFFKPSNSGSMKRLITILAYVSAIGLSWVSLLCQLPIEVNLLILILSLAGISTANYAVTNKYEKPTITNPEKPQDQP
jgi:hypothetical protein